MAEHEMELRKFVAPEMITGDGARGLISRYLIHFGAKRPMLVTDRGVSRQEWFAEIADNIRTVVDKLIIFEDVTPNPKDFEAMMGAEHFLSKECDLLIAVGGGSPMDAAKCISIVSTNGGQVLDYEGVDQINLPGPPLICIPSTSGTAADVSQFAIINDTENMIKKAIISKKVVPDLALIDPRPLMTMDMYLTACTGMDALTHAIEAYVSNAHSTMTDIHALEAIRLVYKHLKKAVIPERKIEDMYGMMIASTQAGLAFSNASLGAVHAMAHSMGGLLDLPHGECNSLLLEHVIAMNYDSVPDRYTRIGEAMGLEMVGKGSDEIKEDLMNSISSLRQQVGIPDCVKVKGISERDIGDLVEASQNDPCMVTNPKELDDSEIGEIFGKIIKATKKEI